PSKPAADAQGFAARKLAAEALVAVLKNRRPLDETLDSAHGLTDIRELPDRDRALVRMLTTTVLRRLGTLRAIIQSLAERGLPKDAPLLEPALLLGAAQILFLDVPDHAAVDLSVRLASLERGGRYAGMTNAVLRRIAREKTALLQVHTGEIDTPQWMFERWQQHYGNENALAIAAAHRLEPPLDLSVKTNAPEWAERLGAKLLPNGTLRISSGGQVTSLPGFQDGDWWVQDMAASLPARLLGDISNLRVADLCAAPGGKTMQLAVAGAKVIAVDRSENRLKRLRSNLERMKLSAEVVTDDAAEWKSEPFDAVLLDAPCSSTGTIRRHPEILWQKRIEDLPPLISLQERILDYAASLTKPGGLLVYAT
ncbi:MAG: transcription antitermination factor NusB, partial [Hyphomicrobium sp.]|nr:transcription antitermination factor NusB [Hyphomicrobium sp.]